MRRIRPWRARGLVGGDLQLPVDPGQLSLGGVATYEDIYKLTYVRGPSGIIVMLAEELKKG